MFRRWNITFNFESECETDSFHTLVLRALLGPFLYKTYLVTFKSNGRNFINHKCPRFAEPVRVKDWLKTFYEMDLEMARVPFLGKHENIDNIPLNGNGIYAIFG